MSNRFASLIAKINELVHRVSGGGSEGVFAKISCRSAKDAITTDTLTLYYQRYIDEVNDEMKRLTTDNNTAMIDNLRLIALTRAGTGMS
jgi:hypothetical protein